MGGAKLPDINPAIRKDGADEEEMRQLLAVCSYYFGRWDRLEGGQDILLRRWVWPCPECRGDFVAQRGLVECVEPRCPAHKQAGAIEIIGWREGLHPRKDLSAILGTLREILEEARAAETKAREQRAAHAKAEAEANAGAETQPRTRASAEAVKAKEAGAQERVAKQAHQETENRRKGASAGAEEKLCDVSAEGSVEERREFDAWRARRDKEAQAQFDKREQEEADTELSEMWEHGWYLAWRVHDALAWVTRAELAKALACSLCVAVCVWVAVDIAVDAYDWITGLLGHNRIAEDDVVGDLVVYGEPVGFVPIGADHTTLRGRLTETWANRYRLLLALVASVLVGVGLVRKLGGDRRRHNALSSDECLQLWRDGR